MTLDPQTILNSAIGSLIVGILLASTAPTWWKWAEKIEGIKTIVTVLVLLGILVALSALKGWIGTRSIPPYHPTFTNAEAHAALAECEIKAAEAAAGYHRRSSQTAAMRRIRAACLVGKGFRWEPLDDD